MSSIPFTSSPLSDANIDTSPSSTLANPSSGSESLIADASAIISSVGNVILGGLAISRLPSGQPGVSTSVQSRSTGTVVSTTPIGLLGTLNTNGSNITGYIIIGLIVLGAIYFFKHV